VIKVGIVGATGYGGRELIRLLAMHPKARLVEVASTSAPGERLDAVLPAFRKTTDLVFQPFDAEAMAKACDAVFVGVPSAHSMPIVAALRRAGVRVLDIGADFRLKDPVQWATYYKSEHTAPECLPEATYGLVPYYREALREATLAAVPGCYPISVILPVRPLLDQALPSVPIVADCISGISGAGRSLNEAYHFPEMSENLRAYKLGTHQHIPEIEQELGGRAMVQFTPHVAPLTRGILSTITIRFAGDVNIEAAYDRYAHEPFVRVLGEGVLPEAKHVRGSNFCDIGWVNDARTGNLLLVSAIDNLMGGTAGMAIQCLNVMFGLDERLGLGFGGMTP